jgi:hypothetical protein
MTTDTTRELTEAELGYLGWTFIQTHPDSIVDHWMATLSGVPIVWDSYVRCIAIARNIARAQGITPPAFAVGDRVIILAEEVDEDSEYEPPDLFVGLHGLVHKMKMSPYMHWQYYVAFDDPQATSVEQFFWKTELERLEP